MSENAKKEDVYVADDNLGLPDYDKKNIYYLGGNSIPEIPTRRQLIAAENMKETENTRLMISKMMKKNKVGSELKEGRLLFMPNSIEESVEFVRPKGHRNYEMESISEQRYLLRIFGVLRDGSKAMVSISGIEVYFDVAIPDEEDTDVFKNRLQIMFAVGISKDEDNASDEKEAKPILISKIEDHLAFPIRGYNESPKRYLRVHTLTTSERLRAIKISIKNKLITASDDKSNYYRKVARENQLTLTDWVVLDEYILDELVDKSKPENKYVKSTIISPICDYNFRINGIEHFRPFCDPRTPEKHQNHNASVKLNTPLLIKSRLLVLAWDIETHTTRNSVPLAISHEDSCFMITLSFHWKDSVAPLLQICLVDVETAPDPRWITIVCGSEVNILKAFALCWQALAPDIQIGFNDSNYDWPFIFERSLQYKRVGTDKKQNEEPETYILTYNEDKKAYSLICWMFDRMSALPYKTKDKTIVDWVYKKDQKIKISAEETFLASYLKIPGCVPIDIRVCYKKLFPKAEVPKGSSLKFYLALSKISGKADLPISLMWKYYRNAKRQNDSQEYSENMRHVAHYCMVDSLRCQQLLLKRNIINDYHEVSALAHLSLADSYFYAGGMKVCNMIGAYAHSKNIMVSMIGPTEVESGKFPGAYVYAPEKGICPDPIRIKSIDTANEKWRLAQESLDQKAISEANIEVAAAYDNFQADRPTTGLDFASLYPSIIQTYNLSPEKIILDENTANEWKAKGRKLHPIDFPYNFRDIKGWSVMHNNEPDNIGLFPSALLDLGRKRAAVKKILNRHGKIKELLENVMTVSKNNNILLGEAMEKIAIKSHEEELSTNTAIESENITISPGSTLVEELAELKRLRNIAIDNSRDIKEILNIATTTNTSIEKVIENEYESACFGWTCANSKQNAIKVYMNTFYGETGNSRSAYFLLQLAGGVTSGGQYNIKFVADYVTKNGFRIKYGDTDSLYLVAPGRYFKDCDIDYTAGRLNRKEWMSAMVRITMRALNQICGDVNDMLKINSGSIHLKMAFEEVLYPVVFTGKKKYFGIPHLNAVNFDNDEPKLFVRGIDVVKQGQPEMARTIGYRIMNSCMKINNTHSLYECMELVLRDAIVNTDQWEFNSFIKSDTWKPEKNNISVHGFISRMKAKHAIEVAKEGPNLSYLYEMPDSGERFNYIIAKTKSDFDLQGRKTVIKKSDKMEYVNAAKILKIEIDVAYYLISYVAGLCARFVNSDDRFQPPSGIHLDEKQIDKFTQKEAKKSIEIFIKNIGSIDGNILRKRGYAYRRAYKKASDIAYTALVNRVGVEGADILHSNWIILDDSENQIPAIVDNVLNSTHLYAAQLVEVKEKEYNELLLARLSNDRCDYLTNYDSSKRPNNNTKQKYYDELIRMNEEIRLNLLHMTPLIVDINIRYEEDISNLVYRMRSAEHAQNPEIGETPEEYKSCKINEEFKLVCISDDDKTTLENYRCLWLKAVAIQMIRMRETSFGVFLNESNKISKKCSLRQ